MNIKKTIAQNVRQEHMEEEAVTYAKNVTKTLIQQLVLAAVLAA
tara:strand:- start:2888 stop:3019 length:132 start_codon:yes stop_codon:yes gene_type:complete